MPSDARWDLIIERARISLAASLSLSPSDLSVLRTKGADMNPSGPEMSRNSPGSSDVAANCPALRTRAPLLLSRDVSIATMASVARKASAGIPMSKTMRLYTDSAESPWTVPMMALPALPARMLW